MKRCRLVKSCFLAAALLLNGCTSFIPPSDALQGQWYFSHIRKGPFFFGQFPPPPRYDGFAFAAPNKIHLQCSLPLMDFYGTYHIAGRRLSYEFQPPDLEKPVRQEVIWAIEDRGHTLVLTLDETEMVYYRPARFLPNTAAGEWTLEFEGHTGTMRLGKEGSYRLDPGGIIGHYRCWASPFGNTMTVVVDIPGCGGQLMLFQYVRQGDRLHLTPITWKGPQPKEATTWVWQRPRPSDEAECRQTDNQPN